MATARVEKICLISKLYVLKIVFHASPARQRVCFAEGVTAQKPNTINLDLVK